MTLAFHSISLAHDQRLLPRLVLGTNALAALLAALALGGWWLGSELLVRVILRPGTGVMMPNTALGLLWSSVALGLLHARGARRWRRRLGRTLAALTLLLGLLTLLEYGLRVQLGMDLLLFPKTVQRMVSQLPGRPSPLSAASLCLTGLALWLLETETRRDRRPAQLLALALGVLALQGLLSYLYLEEAMFSLEHWASFRQSFTPMAVHTAVGFLALSISLLLARPERGVVALMLSDSVGGLMARRLIPAAILVPVLAGGLRLLGERLGIYGVAVGASLIVCLTIVLFLLVISRNARALHDLDLRRHQAENALRESEARLSGIVSSAGEAILSVDEQQRITLFNGAAEHIFGYRAAEVLGQPLELLLPARLGEPHRKHVEDFAASAEASHLTGSKRPVSGLRKNGQVFPAEATLSRLEVNGTRLFTAILRDLSERKQLEQAWRFLAEAGPRLADSLDCEQTLRIVAKMVVPTLADWCAIVLVEAPTRELTTECAAVSATKEEALRALLAHASHEPTSPGRIVAEVVRTGVPALTPEVSDAELEAAAGEARHLGLLRQLAPLSSIVVPLSTRGRTLGAIVLATSESGRRYDTRDLTLAQELARRAALAVDNARLFRQSEQSTRMRDEMLRVVAHDLRSPLQTITLSTSRILRRLPPERSADRKPLDAIQRAVARGNRLIEDLLDMARLEAGHLVVERQPEQLAALVQECLEQHGPIAEVKSLQLSASLPEQCPPLWVDRDRCLQALSNLLGNSIKFTPTGGRITIGARLTGDMMLLSVTDTGPGISTEHLPHVFTPFWQVRGGEKHGAGLGLSIVRGIVEAHGGRLWVESQPGAGTTFFFTLPTLASASVQASAQAG